MILNSLRVLMIRRNGECSKMLKRRLSNLSPLSSVLGASFHYACTSPPTAYRLPLTADRKPPTKSRGAKPFPRPLTASLSHTIQASNRVAHRALRDRLLPTATPVPEPQRHHIFNMPGMWK